MPVSYIPEEKLREIYINAFKLKENLENLRPKDRLILNMIDNLDRLLKDAEFLQVSNFRTPFKDQSLF